MAQRCVYLEYARKHNATVELIIDEKHEWGEIYDNWTGNGILGNIAMDQADLGFGALYTWYHEYKFLDLSLPVVRTGITCLAPAPRLLSGWLSPFFPFSLKLWISVICSFAIVCLIYLFVSLIYKKSLRRKDLFTDILMVIRIFLLQSWPDNGHFTLKKQSIRLLLASFLILSLMFATCYNSGLISSMTLPRYEKPIRTTEDLSESNLEWGATHEAWVFSIKSATQPIIVNILQHFKTLSEDELKYRTETRDYAFSIERLPAGHFAIGNYITEGAVSKLLLMTEDIYWEQCVIMTQKSSPFLPSLNLLILQIHQTGLPLIWETQVALKHLDYQVQLEVKLLSHQQNHQAQERTTLKLQHTKGIFAIWIAGLAVSIICFIVEILVNKMYKNK